VGDLALQIRHDESGAILGQRARVNGDHGKSHGSAPAEDNFANGADLLLAIGKDALKRSPGQLADTAPCGQPGAVVGADDQHVFEMPLFQRADERAALPIDTVSQHHLKLEPPTLQFLNDLDSQFRLGLGSILWLQARMWLVHLEEQWEGDLIQDPIRIHRHHPVGQLPDVANVLGRHVIGGFAFFAVARLVDAQDEGSSGYHLLQFRQPSGS
jgi:hypothetical protein